MGQPECDVYLDEGEEYRWSLIAGNGERVAAGEGHTREHDAWRARRTMLKAAVEVAFREHILGEMVQEIRLETYTERKHELERERRKLRDDLRET